MVSDPKRVLLLVAVVGIVIVGSSPNGVNALPLFSNHTGPTEVTVTDFERLDSDCADEMRRYAGSSMGGGKITKTTTIRTNSADADISVWAERTSPKGADMSTFRVHVDSESKGSSDDVCQTAVRYTVVLEFSGGSPEGTLPDAHGLRILWLENGKYAGCSSSVTSPLRSECGRFTPGSQPERTWENATA
ncbi:hypothetical protein ACFFQF_15030 [Haladaptatus pallidirubidus]|uniref:Secreted protein n=1 Tax=Haladaptatus pallidirubidus TaxID=1008152 RepID=A0AAV3UCN7_9EURY|nr:hypothetical protein [Haladaptatus pallidirubidus]